MLQPLAQQTVTLGVGDYRNHAGVLKARENLRRVLENQKLRKFDQQITPLIDRVFVRIRDGVLNIVVVEMKVASRVKPERPAGRCGNLGQTLADKFRIVTIMQIRMGRGDQVRGTILRRHPHHRDRIGERRRAIVDAVNHMAVNIDHCRCPGPNTIRPGFAPVCSPLRTTAMPFTKTSRIPAEIW